MERVERGKVEPVENVLLPGFHCVATVSEVSPGTWDLYGRQILVRSDYEKAERRLALRLPTALKVDGSYATLFHQGGVSEFTDLGGQLSSSPLAFALDRRSSRILVLVD